MLFTVAVVPGPPAFVAELMGSAADDLDDLRQAADLVVFRAVSDLVAALADSPSSGSPSAGSPSSGSLSAGPVSVQLVVVGPGEPGEFNAAGPVSFASFGRDFEIPALVEGERSDRDLPTPLMVARYLACRDIAAHPEHADLWASARWITTNGVDAMAQGQQLRAEDTLVALILVADGAACHGLKAPRAEDARAQAYDDGVGEALASGLPGRLALLDAELGDALGATGPQVWPLLLGDTSGDGTGEGPWVGTVVWSGAPYGVGWAVAGWRRPATSAGVTQA